MKMHLWTSRSGLTSVHGKAMNICLWSVQGLLAAIFGMAGFMKTLTPMEDLGASMPWTLDVPVWLVRFIGISELAGAMGLLLPAITRIRPDLTPQAGLSLTTVMLLAMLFHVSRGEFQLLPLPLILGALAFFVAWGRFYKEPIEPMD
jgi:uncharacterized membrane protein